MHVNFSIKISAPTFNNPPAMWLSGSRLSVYYSFTEWGYLGRRCDKNTFTRGWWSTLPICWLNNFPHLPSVTLSGMMLHFTSVLLGPLWWYWWCIIDSYIDQLQLPWSFSGGLVAEGLTLANYRNFRMLMTLFCTYCGINISQVLLSRVIRGIV